MKKLILIIGLLFLFSAAALAQEQDFQPIQDNVKKVAQSGLQFLKIGVDARSASMGNIGLTHQGDAVNIFNNPAGIGFVQGASVFVGYTEWIANMSKQALSAAYHIKNIGVIGFHVAVMSLGDIEGTVAADNLMGYEDTGNIDVSENVMGISFAKSLTDRFTFGGTIKLANEDLVVESISVVGFDIGSIYSPGWNGTKIGMAMRNFSGEFKMVRETMTLPYTFMVGISTDLMQIFGGSEGLEEETKWILAFEGNKVRDYSERVHIGSEFTFSNLVSVRAGYKFNYDEEGLTLGTGINHSGIQINYAYRDFGPIFGSTNMVSMSYSF